jgi:hypothetical protein
VLWILRQFVAVAVLPFTVAVVIPIWLARRDGIRFGLGASLGGLVVQGCGVGLLAIGVVLFLASLGRFVSEGKGTLAPWDPPRRLVVRGPYRYVRNPMISGVVIVLFGEAALLLSRPHFLWALVFLGQRGLHPPARGAAAGRALRRRLQRVPAARSAIAPAVAALETVAPPAFVREGGSMASTSPAGILRAHAVVAGQARW